MSAVARERRLAFGDVAELYDRARPSYPGALVDAVMALVPTGSAPRALEVGAGTGKATVLFAARGVAVHALEPSAEMAAVARRNCAAYPEVSVELSDFEHWRGPRAGFGLLYSAQAWHWVSRETRYAKARSALAPGGVLATFWNRPEWESCGLREELDDAYARAASELPLDGPMRPANAGPPEAWGDWAQEIDGAEGLSEPELRTYRWEQEYSAAEYAQLLRTHSDHLMLEPGVREALCRAVTDVIDRHGGVLPLTYLTRLCLARAV